MNNNIKIDISALLVSLNKLKLYKEEEEKLVGNIKNTLYKLENDYICKNNKIIKDKNKNICLFLDKLLKDKEENIGMTSFSKHKEYRNRINQMYEGLKGITPIDGEVDNVIYFNDYTEKGIVVKPKVSSLKQFWTEYRLINNEKISPKIKIVIIQTF